MNVYNSIKESNVKNDSKSMNEMNGIKIGDMIVFEINEMEFKGHVNDILNDKYVINGNFSMETKQLSIEFDQILEHYPKNINFPKEEEINERRPEPPEIYDEGGKLTRYGKLLKSKNKTEKEEKKPDLYPKGWKDLDGIMMNKTPKKTIVKEDLLKPPVEKTLKNKNVIFFPDEMKQKEIDKALVNFKEAKYFIVEKNEELHIVKIKDGFEMKPFVESVISHLLKNKMIKEDISSMKVVGNNQFCIIKNSPDKTTSLIKGLLSNLLK